MRLANKVAIISGAASGMGAATARIFAREGARVVIADVLEHEGRQVATAIGASARFEPLDVTKEEGWAAVVGLPVSGQRARGHTGARQPAASASTIRVCCSTRICRSRVRFSEPAGGRPGSGDRDPKDRTGREPSGGRQSRNSRRTGFPELGTSSASRADRRRGARWRAGLRLLPRRGTMRCGRRAAIRPIVPRGRRCVALQRDAGTRPRAAPGPVAGLRTAQIDIPLAPRALKSASETAPRGAPCGSPRDRTWRAQAPARYRPSR